MLVLEQNILFIHCTFQPTENMLDTFTTDSLSKMPTRYKVEYLGTRFIDGVGVSGKSVPADYFGYGGYFQGGFVVFVVK